MSRVIEVVRRGPRGTDGIAGASGAMIFISSQDASASAVLNFTGFNASLYDGYYFHIANLIPATDGATLNVRTSSDGGSTYDSGVADYAYQQNATVTSADAEIVMTRGVGNAAGEDGVSGGLWIYGPHLAKRTAITFSGLVFGTSTTPFRDECSGVRLSAADVDAIQFLMSAGNITSGTITMYGLKNSV
jgi:hypothetical protein